ncbi:MAG: hypothetical protein GX330_00840 [Bacteroidales bacterium]|nr:hypothetical protein [Bacteroidales bacterium]
MKQVVLKSVFKVFLSVILLQSTLYGQSIDVEKSTADDKYKGFDFYFNCGMYMGNKFTANYYNGISNEYVSINRAVGNKYVKEAIENLILANQNVILDADGVSLSEVDRNMRYNVSFVFGFGMLYHLNKNLALTLSFGQTRLNALGGVTFTYNTGVAGNERPQILRYHLNGKELRNFFEIGVNYIIRTNPHVQPFFELAGQLNSVKVQHADLVVEDRRFTMMDMYAGQSYVPNSGLTEIAPVLGGAGGGILGGMGIRIPFAYSIALEPVIQVQYTYINLEVNNTKKMMPHYNLMVRLIVGDRIFSGNYE